MKNKLICLILAAAMVCSMAGCSKNSDKERNNRDRDEIEEDEDEDDRDIDDDEDDEDDEDDNTDVHNGPPEVTHNIHGWDEETSLGSDANVGIISEFYFTTDPELAYTTDTYGTFGLYMPSFFKVDGRETWISSAEAATSGNGVYTGFDFNWENSENGYDSDIILYLEMIGCADSMTVEMAVQNAENEDPAWIYTRDRNWWSSLGTAPAIDGLDREYETERIILEYEGFIFFAQLQYANENYCTKEDAEKYLLASLENMELYPDTARDVFGV